MWALDFLEPSVLDGGDGTPRKIRAFAVVPAAVRPERTRHF